MPEYRSFIQRRKARRPPGSRSVATHSSRGLRFEQLEERSLFAVIPGLNLTTGTQLTTYTLAIATTAEFTQTAGGKTATAALLNQFVSELNKIYEPELAITFRLHAQNNNLIFENAGTDGYTNGVVTTMINQNPGVINQTLNGNSSNDNGYDFGHVLGIGSDGGIAGVGIKANAALDLFQAAATLANISLLAHEFAHQMSAVHTYNGSLTSCALRDPTTAIEPGSGSTILSYQGLCAGDNLPEFPGDQLYFHAASFDAIVQHTSSDIASRGTKTATGNQLPTVSAGLDRTIPAATPFTLTATGTDADAADRLTYTWEQIDTGGAVEVLQGAVLTVSGRPATAADSLNQLDQTTADYVAGDKIRITGTDVDGTAISGTYTYESGDTIASLLSSGLLTQSIETSYYDSGNFPTADVWLSPQGRILVESRTAGNAGLSLTLAADTGDGHPSTGKTTFGAFTLLVDGRNDPGAVSVPIPNSQDKTGPLFRSFAPSSDTTRIFPRIEDILANTPASQNKNEHLPTQSRDLNFRVTARDNHLFQGKAVSGVVSDDGKLTVVNTGTPFRVTSLNAANSVVVGGSRQTITWDVAGTTANGINTSKVDILLSNDGGLTYPIKLAVQTNNDGSQEVFIPNVSIAKARIKVQADPAQNIFFDVNDADVQVTQNLAAPGGIVITESGGSTQLAEGLFALTGMSQTDTYTIALTTAPSSAVVVTVTADSQVELSVDGTSFAATQVVTFNAGDNAAKTITLRSINDSTLEGFHIVNVQHAVTQSTDSNYNPQILTADTVNAIFAQISDDDAPPLIGADFDGNFGVPPVSPTNWSQATNPFAANFTNMRRENGLTTTVDLTFALSNPAGNASIGSTNLIPGTIPLHSPDLTGIDGVFSWDAATVTATWSDLVPNAKYRVYTFATANGTSAVNQTVTITGSGAGNPAPFTQNSTGKTDQLLVNALSGNSSTNLEQFAAIVTADQNGRVIVRVDRLGSKVHLAGLAIQELFEAPPGITIVESNGSTQVSENSGTTDTLTVVLDAPPTSNVVVTVVSSDTTEARVDKSTLTFTPANWSTPQTVTVTGIQDNNADGDQLISITVAVDPSKSDSRYATVAAKQISVSVFDAVANPWQNLANRYDVNDDDQVVPLDVLQIINELNQPKYTNPSTTLPATRTTGVGFFDVDGNGFITPLDALSVINFLNRPAVAEGERPFSFPIWVDPDDELESVLEELAKDRIWK